MGLSDYLFQVGTKALFNFIDEKTSNKSDSNSKMTVKKIKDDALKAFEDTNADFKKIEIKAKKIQEEEMASKSIEELSEIISKGGGSPARNLAANLELKTRV